MANWWSLVNCWGRRDTRAKKVIVIEYKSHQIKKAVTELCTHRVKGPCGHMADAADSRTWPGQPMACWRAQYCSPWLPGLSSQASPVTGAWAWAAVQRLPGCRGDTEQAWLGF